MPIMPHPLPYRGNAWMDKNSPAAQQAIAEFNAGIPFDIREVMRDEWWNVALVDGHPEVMLGAEGVRALARFAPRKDAMEFAEEVIRIGRAQR